MRRLYFIALLPVLLVTSVASAQTGWRCGVAGAVQKSCCCKHAHKAATDCRVSKPNCCSPTEAGTTLPQEQRAQTAVDFVQPIATLSWVEEFSNPNLIREAVPGLGIIRAAGPPVILLVQSFLI